MAPSWVNQTICDVQRITDHQTRIQADVFTGLSGHDVNEKNMANYKTYRVYNLERVDAAYHCGSYVLKSSLGHQLHQPESI